MALKHKNNKLIIDFFINSVIIYSNYVQGFSRKTAYSALIYYETI